MNSITSFLLSLGFLLLLSDVSFASLPVAEKPTLPEYLKVGRFIKMSPSEFSLASGHRLNGLQKLYFKKLQRRLKKSKISSEATILPFYDVETGRFKLDPVWFVLGCIIGPFAVLFSYTTRNQTKNKHLSALIGFGVFVLWFGFIFLF